MKPLNTSVAVLLFLCGSFLAVNGQGSAGSYVRRLGPLVNNPNRPTAPPPPARTPAPPPQSYPAPASQATGQQGVPLRLPSPSAEEVDKKRLQWQIDRAEKGSPSAQFDLGMRYLKGDGVEQNEELGRGWLEKAANQGDNQAYQKLKNTDYLVEKRDDAGRIIQSRTARHEFMKNSGHPTGRPGYVITHIISIAKGGIDASSNMQWQTIEEARAKESSK